MALIEKMLDGVQGALRVNPNTLSGSVDIIIVKHRDGTLKSTPFHVRFGKNQVIRRSRERLPIYISVNDVVAPFNMVMGDGGVAYFEVPVDETSDQVPLGDLKNPVPSPSASPMLSSASPLLTSSDPGSPVMGPTLTRRRNRNGDGNAAGGASSSSSSSSVHSTSGMVPLAQAIGEYLKENENDNGSDDSDDEYDDDDIKVEYSDDDGDDDDDDETIDGDDKVDESFDWKWGEFPEKVASTKVNESGDATRSNTADSAETGSVPISDDFTLSIEAPEEVGEEKENKCMDCTVEMSLCAHLLSKNFESETDPEVVSKNKSIFKQHIVTFNEYSANPQLIYDPRIAIMADGTIYGGKSGIELLVSLAVFHKKPAHRLLQQGGQNSATAHISLMAPEQQQELQEEYMLNEELARTRQSWIAWIWSWAKWLALSPIKIPQSLFFAPAPKRKAPKKAITNYYSGPRCFRKSLRPSEEQLRMLNFHDGANTITFFIKTGKGGQIKSVRSSLYVVDEDAKIIISDIDGTITKSDALGHIFNFIGKDWSQSGVAQLYTRIHDNGYLILYLTSRAIGQAQSTRNYISSVRQSHSAYFGTYTLPPGPVFMSPFRLLNAIDKELLKRVPHEFKMACLADILSLFPLRAKPFYAGFGNKDTDVKSYDFVGVDSSRIFIVNPRGIVHTNVHSPEATYISLNDTVDSIFPPTHKN